MEKNKTNYNAEISNQQWREYCKENYLETLGKSSLVMPNPDGLQMILNVTGFEKVLNYDGTCFVLETMQCCDVGGICEKLDCNCIDGCPKEEQLPWVHLYDEGKKWLKKKHSQEKLIYSFGELLGATSVVLEEFAESFYPEFKTANLLVAMGYDKAEYYSCVFQMAANLESETSDGELVTLDNIDIVALIETKENGNIYRTDCFDTWDWDSILIETSKTKQAVVSLLEPEPPEEY